MVVRRPFPLAIARPGDTTSTPGDSPGAKWGRGRQSRYGSSGDRYAAATASVTGRPRMTPAAAAAMAA